MNLKAEFYNKLKHDKIKINWNNNPIKMDQFLSFLTVDIIRSHDHLGVDNGWTKLYNDELGLIICGGRYAGVEYLDSIQFGKKLANQYNNYVNPFYIFEILTDDGKLFFIDYYKDEIVKIVEGSEAEIDRLKNELRERKTLHEEILKEVEMLVHPKH